MNSARQRHLDRESLDRFTEADEGQDLLEYGLLAALISVFAVGTVTLLGQQLDRVFWQTIATNF
jgi:Flp pilus assembly pilin Flp